MSSTNERLLPTGTDLLPDDTLKRVVRGTGIPTSVIGKAILYIDQSLHTELKVVSAQSGRTLQSVTNEIVLGYLEAHRKPGINPADVIDSIGSEVE